MTDTSIFHSGEVAAQKRAGVADLESRVAGFIRPYLPQQHRDFYTALPFVVLSAADNHGRPWVTILEGDQGFVSSPDDKALTFDRLPDPDDPLFQAMTSGADVGMLGIELATRRRNRLSGFLKASGSHLELAVRQTFGNCPQYIHERAWHRVAKHVPGEVKKGSSLSQEQILRIRHADTMFVGSGQQGEANAPSNGYDASHRGGAAGFVQVVNETHLRIPDYAGNNFFNTIGNILQNPRVGLLFIDFATGGMLQLSGTASIDWEPANANDPLALRMIDFTVQAVIDRPAALALRWQEESPEKRQVIVGKKIIETPDVSSFILYPADMLPLETFKAGQHLPVSIEIPGQSEKTDRSYSLSGPQGVPFYRLSIKREPLGLVSRYLHDRLEIGDSIEVGPPSGEFVVPGGNSPLVLVSAGIGITPVLAMLYAVAHASNDREVWFVHGAKNSEHYALAEEVKALIASGPNFAHVTHFSNPMPRDRQGKEYDFEGRISPQSLMSLGAGKDAHYMLCGPSAFLSAISSGLEQRGVPENQIHFETFGPGG